MRVTVVIPFFNARETILDAVRSVFAQTYTDWELLLGDDGSTDGAADDLRQIRDPRLRVLSDGRRLGLGGRLNALHKLVSTALVARLDADDMMHPARLHKQVDFLSAHPDVDVVGTGIVTVDQRLRPTGKRNIRGPILTLHDVIWKGCVHTTTGLGRTSWFNQNPYDESLKRGQDHELYCRTIGTSRFANLEEHLCFYREDPRGYFWRYARSWWHFNRIYLRYGQELGASQTSYLIFLNSLKLSGYAVSGSLGLIQHVFRARSTAIDGTEIRNFENIIESIMKTPIPK